MSNSESDWTGLDHRFVWHPFTQMREWLGEAPCIIERGNGSILVDTRGREYLDGVSSLWCNLHGHRRRELDEALKNQLDLIAHSTFLGLSHVPGIELARRLIEVAPAGLQRVFYSDNGAGAVEVALKMAFQYWQLKGQTRRTGFATLTEAYHGDTVGAMSLGYSETFHRFHRPLLFPALRIDPPHVFRYYQRMSEADALGASLKQAEDRISAAQDTLAALVVEPLMQGAAGMWAQPRGYIRALSELCRSHGLLLIVDEVATGFGRTGRLFACEHEGVTPDFLCLAKGITGGYLPLAATLTTEEVFEAFLGDYDEFKSFFHGHTYTGNPLGCAVGLASLKLFETDGVLASMQPKIASLQKRLAKDFLTLAHVGDTRQWGFMVGIELVENKATLEGYPAAKRMGHRVVLEARRNGAIIRPLGDVIVLMPPLSITDQEIERLLDIVHLSIKTVTEN